MFHHEYSEYELQQMQQYYEEHWTEYRDKAIKELRKSLKTKQVLHSVQMKRNGILELRKGVYSDADNIHTRDHNSYPVTSLGITKELNSFKILSLSKKPLSPLGYYFLRFYRTHNRYNTKTLSKDSKKNTGELTFIYVSPPYREKHYGSIFISLALLDIIDNEQLGRIEVAVADFKVGEVLNKLGIKRTGTGNYGYALHTLNIADIRDQMREAVKNYLSHFIIA